MKLVRVIGDAIILPPRHGKGEVRPVTNRDILVSVIETCDKYHEDCETCPYWLKNKLGCIWYAHKIIGKDVMAYWDDEIEEKML